MLVNEAMEKMAKEAKSLGSEQFDILAGSSESYGLSVFKGEVQNVEISNTRGLGIRLFRDGFPGYAHTERFTESAIKDAVNIAWDNSFLTGKQFLELPQAIELPKIDLDQWSESLEQVNLDEFTPLCLEMEKLALEAEEVINVPYLGMSKSSSTLSIFNSNGLFYQNSSNLLSGGIGCVAQRGENNKLGYYSSSLKDISQFNAKHIAETAVQRSVELLGAGNVESGNYPVVLSNRISAQLFSMFSSGFYADRVQKGQSRLEGKLHSKIASSQFQLWNEPHRRDLSGSSLFDAEGVPTQKMPIVEEGVLKNLLYNLESAQKEGLLSTGNATRGYSSRAGTAFQNYVVGLGDKTLEELLSEMGTGLYVVKLEGGSGCSAISGDISIGIQGFWVENGLILRPVDGATLSTNFYDLISRIQGISNAYNPHFSSVKVPDLLIESVSLAG